MLQRSKLYAPPLAHEAVARARLLEALEALRPGGVFAIVAPAGYGKTTLVSQWLASRGAKSAAWLTLEAADGDARRCARYVCAALEKALPSLEGLVSLLDAGAPTGARELAEALLEELRGGSTPVVLVLDDYHALAPDADAHELLAHLAEHCPPLLSLVVTSRSAPPFPGARMRARGKLLELDAAAMRFSAAEAAQLLHARGLSLPRPILSKLAERTEGWAVGLVLASLLLRQGGEPEALLAQFRGTHHWVADYLVQEVLRGEPETVREFVLLSAALPELSEELCAAAGLRSDLASLSDLFARGLFLTPLDTERRRFRYHDLVRELLLDRALASLRPRVREIRLRAARWLSEHDRPETALELLLLEGEHTQAAELFERHSRSRLLVGEFASLRSFLEAIPEEVRNARPRLLTLSAWTLPDERRARLLPTLLARADELLTEAARRDGAILGPAHRALGISDTATRDQLFAEIAMMRSFAARMRRDFDEASRLSECALELSREGGIPVRARAATGLGQDAFMRGDFALAREQLERALAIALDEGELVSVIMAQGYLVEVLSCAGELDLALSVAYRVGRWMERHKLSRVPLAKWQRGGLAVVFLERNQLDRAAEVIEPLLRLEHGAPLQQMVVQARLATLARARGDFERAERALDAIDAIRRATGTQYSFGFASIPAMRADLALRRGQPERALAWYRQHGAECLASSDFLSEGDREIAVRVKASALDAAEASQQALSLAEQAAQHGRITRAVSAQMMAAHAMLRTGQHTAAASLLARCFETAEAHGLHRCLIDSLPDATSVLRFASERSIGLSLTRRLVAGLTDATGELRMPVDGLAEALRPRELQVLKLLGEGLKNEHIAQRLGIQTSTVKVHLRALYAKLGAQSRAHALARARELRLP